MSYRAGTRGLASIGLPDGEPRLICDGCGTERPVRSQYGLPYVWFLARRRAPGWGFDGTGEFRKDWCAACAKTKKETT